MALRLAKSWQAWCAIAMIGIGGARYAYWCLRAPAWVWAFTLEALGALHLATDDLGWTVAAAWSWQGVWKTRGRRRALVSLLALLCTGMAGMAWFFTIGSIWSDREHGSPANLAEVWGLNLNSALILGGAWWLTSLRKRRSDV